MFGVVGTLDIGEVVRRTGVPVSTLHVWERRGLIAPVSRAGLRRQYAQDAVLQIAFILVCRSAGFTLAEIAALTRSRHFSGSQELLRGKLDELIERRRQLDLAIEGIRHAMACTASSFAACPDFARHLDEALPRRAASPGDDA